MKLTTIKDKDRILKAAEEKNLIQVNPNKAVSWILNRNLAGQERTEWYIQSAERGNLPSKNTLPKKFVLQKWRQGKYFP